MAISYDNATTTTISSGGSTGSILSFVVGSGSNRIMLVIVSTRGSVSEPTVVFNTSETFGAAIGHSIHGTGIAENDIWLFKLIAPSSTTANIDFDFGSSLSYNAEVSVVTYTGVDQTTPVPTIDDAIYDGYGTSITYDLTTTIANSLALGFHGWRAGTVTYTSDYTQRISGTNSDTGTGSDERVAATAGSYTLSGTFSGNAVTCGIYIELAEATGGGPAPGGWSGNFNGINSSQIKEINGIPIANILSVN